MPFVETGFPGLSIFEPQVFGDHRGYFLETYNENTFKAAGIMVHFVQDNESKSNFGVVRGLHYQTGVWSQAKLVRVMAGSVLDVVLDLRKGSPTFGKTFEAVLSGENKKQVFIPRGFAHGFSVLEDNTIFCYKCDNFYNKESEGGIRFSDPALGIDWRIPEDKMLVSDKDLHNPVFADLQQSFIFSA